MLPDFPSTKKGQEGSDISSEYYKMWRKWVTGEPEVVEWKYEDLPCPVTDEDMLQVVENEKQIRESWVTGTEKDGWKLWGHVDGISVEELQVEGSPIHVVRARGIIQGVDLQKMLDSFTHGGLDERRQISADILTHEMVYKMPDNPELYISYSAFNTPLGVSSRDFLTLRNLYYRDNGSALIVSQSINMESRPFKAGFVRATTRNARFFEPIEGKEGQYRLTLVDHVNPRGHVPGFVVNLFKKKAAEAIVKLQHAYGKGQVLPNDLTPPPS